MRSARSSSATASASGPGALRAGVERSLETSIQDPLTRRAPGTAGATPLRSPGSHRYGGERIADLRARAWAFVGNACRLRFDFQGAEEAFRQAPHNSKKGTRDGLEQAIFLDLKASLRRGQRRFDESACELLRRAVDLFLEPSESGIGRAARW